MKGIVVFFLVAGFAAATFAQSSAKALFHDTSTGVTVVPTPDAPKQVAKRPPSTPHTITQPVANVTQPAVTGLMYWIELRTDKQQLLRVDSSRVFHTGERIRIHVTSNVDGRLVIMQSQNGGQFQMLFPTGKIWDNKVQKFQERTFPSERTWFKFDDKPGELRLMMMATADPVASGGEQLLASNAPPAGGPADPRSEAATASEIRAKIEKLRGSKALVVEEDKTDVAAPVSYVVVDSRKESADGGAVAVEIKLNHRL